MTLPEDALLREARELKHVKDRLGTARSCDRWKGPARMKELTCDQIQGARLEQFCNHCLIRALVARVEALEKEAAEHHDCVTKAVDEAVEVHDRIEAKRDGIEAQLTEAQATIASLRGLVKQWRAEAEDAKRRGYPESCVQQQVDANELDAALQRHAEAPQP